MRTQRQVEGVLCAQKISASSFVIASVCVKQRCTTCITHYSLPAALPLSQSLAPDHAESYGS